MIVFEDSEILVVNKPSGLATQSEVSSEESLLDLLSKQRKVFLINRLDKRVSGLVVFAKSIASQKSLTGQLEEGSIRKFYRAIVKNQPEKIEDRLCHWLLKDEKSRKTKVFDKEIKYAKKAELRYKLLISSEKYHLLDIELFTGRFHQIRAQLSAIGSPILGDLKYGYKRSSPDGSIFLQSYKIQFFHPNDNKVMEFELQMPEIWKKYGF